MTGGPGSLPPPPKPVLAKKPVLKKIEPKMMGGPGSLPPKPEIKKAEPAKKVEAKED